MREQEEEEEGRGGGQAEGEEDVGVGETEGAAGGEEGLWVAAQERRQARNARGR